MYAIDITQKIDYIINGKGDKERYERKDSITEKDLDTAQINSRKDVLLLTKRDAFREKRAEEAQGEVSHEHSADGSTGTGTLESDESGNLSADGGRRGARTGKRSSGKTDNEGNGSADVDWDVGAGSLAGEPAPIHLQDSDKDGAIVSPGTGRERESDSSPSVSEPRTIQLSGVNPGNYRITEQDDICSGTRGQRIDRNLAAIRLVKNLIKERRYPTKKEQAVLDKYAGH